MLLHKIVENKCWFLKRIPVKTTYPEVWIKVFLSLWHPLHLLFPFPLFVPHPTPIASSSPSPSWRHNSLNHHHLSALVHPPHQIGVPKTPVLESLGSSSLVTSLPRNHLYPPAIYGLILLRPYNIILNLLFPKLVSKLPFRISVWLICALKHPTSRPPFLPPPLPNMTSIPFPCAQILPSSQLKSHPL